MYLGPLQSEGKSITPCFIHSDLWAREYQAEEPNGRALHVRRVRKLLNEVTGVKMWGSNSVD